MATFPQPDFMPCSECGASLHWNQGHRHVCDSERKLDFEVLQHRRELEALEAELDRYLATPRGRFEQWCAERERRQSR